MFTLLGLLFLIAGIAMFVLKITSQKEEVNNGRHYKAKSPDWMVNWKVRNSIILFVVAVFMFLTPYAVFFSDRGYNYLLVHPGGNMTAVMEQGIKWRGFAKIDPWQKYMDVKVVGDGIEIDESEIEGIMMPVSLRFIDQVTATGFVSLRFELPSDEQKFINLAVRFRTMSNLISNTIIPTAKEQLTNTAYMFAAQDYISGEAQSFRQTYEDMLKNGTFAVEKYENIDTVYNEISMNNKKRTISNINTVYEVVKILKNGIPVRIPHELSENNIIVSQVIVDDVLLEDAFKTRLEAQRDESAKRQLEQQKVKTAKDAQARIIAEGERDKAEERVIEEKKQISVLIAKETLLKEEETNRQLAEIQLATQEINAKTVKVKADADAYEIQKKVYAGITPETRLQMELDASVARMAEFAKLKLPTTWVESGGSSKGSGGLLESLIGAELAKGMLKSPNIK